MLSEVEVFGSTTHSVKGEGTQYDYYKAGNKKIKKYNGSDFGWYERSPNSGDTMSFCSVNGYGNAHSYYADVNSGVSFGFCF